MGFINQLVKFLQENAAVKLEIDGHTDSDGDEAANLKLSQDRADAVKKQLVVLGIDALRLTCKGFGKTKPVDNNTTPEGKANNRRVEFVKK
jgi:outer membrane protein OmpA-like peptidoglycan-associated protein